MYTQLKFIYNQKTITVKQLKFTHNLFNVMYN